MCEHILYRDIKCELVSEGLLTLYRKSIVESLQGDFNKISTIIDCILRSSLQMTLPIFVETLSKCGYKNISERLQPAEKLVTRRLQRSSPNPLQDFHERLQMMRDIDTEDFLKQKTCKYMKFEKCDKMEEAILRCWAILCNSLTFDNILDTLLSKKLITSIERQYICTEKSNRDKMDSYLTFLVKSDLLNMFSIFLETIQDESIKKELICVYNLLQYV